VSRRDRFSPAIFLCVSQAMFYCAGCSGVPSVPDSESGSTHDWRPSHDRSSRCVLCYAHLFAAFSRHLSRYYPLMDRPAVLRWLCADETWSTQCVRRRTLTAQLSCLLSTLLLDIEHDATDRFMRDAICGCYAAEWFLLLHHTMHYDRPKFGRNTIVWKFRSWTPILENRRMTSMS
jgi:hypothetical protein